MSIGRAARYGPAVVILITLAVLPQVLSSYWVERITPWIPLAVAALALNLLTGYNGQISVGHGALFGFGAYTTGLLVTKAGAPFLLAVVGSAAVCFVIGVLIGLPALRIKGLYLALVTLAVAMLFPDLLRQFDSLTGGPSGFYLTTETINSRGVPVDQPIKWTAPSWTGLAPDQWKFYVFAIIAVLCFLLVRNLIGSRTGRAIIAIRDNEVAAEVNGVNVAAVKVGTFGLSAALAGVGGALFALHKTQLFPQSFTITMSLYFLVAVVVGGPATILGPAIGALVYGVFDDVIRPELPERLQPATPLILGVSLILLMLVAPGGATGWARQIYARRRARQQGGAEHSPTVVPHEEPTP